uniref:Castor zinc finger 1 n=1 Tax=Cynoglossus semilaevis TaxID=244447 RepID=A0A3P8V7D7_CYNSE
VRWEINGNVLIRVSDSEEESTERNLCTETTSGKSKMAAKRKGGLKLNAICAKLSRQVVFDSSSQNAEGDQSVAENSERGSSHYDDNENNFHESLSLSQSLEEDQKRREAIEKWVNGEYGDEPPAPEDEQEHELKVSNDEDGPPEGVYMVQPKGCSDEEDNADEAEPEAGSQDGSYHEDKDSEDKPPKNDSFMPQGEAQTSALRDYAANTMNEFLGMFGYDDHQVRDELTKKISFEKLKAATSDPSSLSSEEASRRARFSKYEEYIRKLKAGETLPWSMHASPPKPDDLNAKLAQEKSTNTLQTSGCIPGAETQIYPSSLDHKQPGEPQLSTSQPSNPTHMQNMTSRASKYDFFIQKLKMGESLQQQNGNAYKRPSKYDLENVRFLHLFKPGEGNPNMGGAIAFKTGKVGRPSKYDIRTIQKLMPGNPEASMAPNVLATAPGNPGVPGVPTAGAAGASITPGLTMDQTGHMSYNTPDYLKSSFSKTDSITTGTVSSVKNGLPPDKPAGDDINLYQKYIARFSGSQHCGHVHCAYQYREHYHCMDPDCNYQRFTSKQDVIRHYNMHKKRDNSLQHGFMRFSPLDDCSVYYHGCHLNGKSTHYHCMQVGCSKVYTSTSDVMTHENFHKKNAQLINDGFQRFRATEDCGTVGCQFYGQKTTHFHCRWRPGCTFTFKNKCDIEKHKSYHIKDDAYAKDGFKKFYKYEECKYEGCVYSKATNHFHCIRSGCGFTFTSTSQMTSHKRKHERRHIRSSGVMGLSSTFLTPKDEPEDSSNDDLMDFSAISSKNSSLSASPTTQQSTTVPHLLATPTTAVSSSTTGPVLKPSHALATPGQRMPSLLSQALPSNMPVALALSNNPFFPLMAPRLPLQPPPQAASLISAASSGAHSMPTDSLTQGTSTAGADGSLASTPTSFATSSLMEKITASKGMISPMMARLAAAALKPSNNTDPGQSLYSQSLFSCKSWLNIVHFPCSSNESNGHPVPGNTSLLSSLMNKMTQMNPILFNTMNIKTELEQGQANNTSEVAQYLNRVLKRPVQEKPTEIWRTYLRRFDTDDYCETQCDFLHKVHFHCMVEDCGALFSTVDGAIKHANFHLRATIKVKSESQFGEVKDSSEGAPPQPAAPVSMANNPSMDVAHLSSSGGYSSPPSSLLAWKQLTGTIPQLSASMPNLPANSTLATTSLENAKPQVKPGFLQFQENDPCLATDCKYSNKFHFHCLFGNCKYVCKTSGKAESHCLDHINPNNNLVNIRDQFSYYSLQCLCPNQHCEFRMRGHYHCLRPGCFFVTNITTKLPWHIKKHEKAERRAANGFKYFTKREECGRLGCKYNQVNSHFHCIREGCQFSFLLKHQMTSHARKHMRRMLGKNFDRVPSQHGSTHNFSAALDETDDYMDYVGGGGGSPLGLSSESSNQDRSCTSTPVGNDSSPAGNTISIPTAPGAKKRIWIIEDMSPFGKRRKTASSRKMLDEGMMLDGFRRYDLYENCKDTGCQFSLKVTHYHCTRENCGYKFCGRTHMYKHAQHHDRVDNLVLDDFKRFKSSLSCNFPDCQFSGNSTHFHCLRCGFRCTDSTKVTAHRKHHGKQDVISAAGFCQFSSSADCEVPDCKYKLKCSHFHCTFPECKHTVVGMSQMDSHKRKHEKQERGELSSVSPKQEGAHHMAAARSAVPPVSMALSTSSPGGLHGLSHNINSIAPSMVYPLGDMSSDYNHTYPPSAISLDGSLNLCTDTNSSLFFLKNASGLGLNDSLDLSKKIHHEAVRSGHSPAASLGLAVAQEDTTGTSGEAEDDLSPEEEVHAEEEEDDDDDDDDEEEEEAAEDDLNSDSNDDLMLEPDGEKDNEESYDASVNHTGSSQLEKQDTDP